MHYSFGHLAPLLIFIIVCYLCNDVFGTSSTSWLSQCAAEGHGELKRLYVSTLDGKLTALDAFGKRHWRYKFSQPLYSSTLRYSEPSSEFPNLIPGLDKKLYHWDGVHLTPLSLSIEDLITEEYSSNGPDIIRAGGRIKEDVALDIPTGKPLYRCSQYNCHKYDNHSQIGQMDRLLVTAHRTTIREANRLTGDELWNFTISRLNLLLLEGEVDDDVSCQLDNNELSDWIVNVDSSKGILFVSNSFTKTSWSYTFPSPITDVWLHHGGKLEKVSLSPLQYPLSTRPSLLLGVWHNQYYIQPTIDDTQLSLRPNWNTWERGGYRYGNDACDVLFLPNFAPILPTDSHGDKEVALYNEHNNWLNDISTDGPNGLCLYFHLVDSEDDHNSCYRELENTSDETTPINQIIENPGYLITALEYSKTALRYAIFAVIVLAVNKLRRYHTQLRRSNTSSDDDDVFRLPDELGPDSVLPPAFENRRSSSSSTIKPSPTYDLLPILEEENTRPPSNTIRSDSNDPVGSRFDTEYDFIGVLGKGGYGVVYHVKNKTDNIDYALKRIKLPEKKFARDKVMREVHALAQLDHPHIVRYFNSWVERAPLGWDQRDEWVPLSRVSSLLKMEDGSSSKPLSRPSSSSSSHPLSSSSSLVNTNSSIPLSSIPRSFSPELPPLRPLANSDSQSSFTIEFREDSQSKLSGDECQSNSSILLSNIRRSSLSSNDIIINTNTTMDTEEESTRHDNSSNITTDTSIIGFRSPSPSQLVTPSFVFIQMQLCQKESLRDWLKKNVNDRPRLRVWAMFEQILTAVVYVHTKGLMHRDLKPSNIFFSFDGGVKVGDFGLVTGHVAPDTHNNSFNVLKHLGQESDGARHTGNIGTHFYVSPEQMMGLKYDQKVDIFSLGVILFEMNHPFSTEMERAKILENLRKGKLPTSFKNHLQHEASFVEWLMSPVTNRPTANEIINSGRLEELKEMINNSDCLYIPKL